MLKNISLTLVLSLNLTLLQANSAITEKELINSIKKGVPSIEKLLREISIYKLYVNDKTLLHYATEAGNYKVVSYLVRHNILLGQKGGSLYGTALHVSILHGYPRIANFLIEQGTPVNEQDIEGNTALHLAAKSGDLSIIQNLLEHGASKYILNAQGETAFSLVETLSVDDTDEIKRLLFITEHKNNFNYNTLKFDDELRSINIDKNNNIIIKKIDTRSTFQNSNLGINIHSKKR